MSLGRVSFSGTASASGSTLMGSISIKRKTKSKGSFPTEESAFKVLYLATQEQQAKWHMSSIRNWFEIYPQLSIFFSETMSKYTK